MRAWGSGVTQLPPDWLEQLRAIYPRRDGHQGWMQVRTVAPRALTAGATWERMLAGTKAYRAHCERKGITGTDFVAQAKTFFGPQMLFDEYADMPAPISEAERKEAESMQKLIARRAAIGLPNFREPYPNETSDEYRASQDVAWNEARRNVTPIRRA